MFIIPVLQSADTFPQAVACAPHCCGGGKVSAGEAAFCFQGVALLSVLGGSVWALGWLYFAVQLALMGRYLQPPLLGNTQYATEDVRSPDHWGLVIN